MQRQRSWRSTVAIAGLCGAIAIAAVAWHRHGAIEEPASSPLEPVRLGAITTELLWQAGKQYTYAVSWQSRSTVALFAASPSQRTEPIQGEVRIEADLVLRSYGKGGESYELDVLLENVTQHKLVALKADLLPDEPSVRAAFDGQVASVTISPRGEVQKMGFRPDSPQIFRRVMAGLLTQMSISLPSDGAPGGWWSVTEPGPSGSAMATYKADPANPRSLYRIRTQYAEMSVVPRHIREAASLALDSASTVTLSPNDLVETIRDHEVITLGKDSDPMPQYAAQTRFEARLLSVGDHHEGAEGLAAMTVVWQPGEINGSKDTAAKLLDQRIAKLGEIEMMDTIDLYAGASPGRTLGVFVSRAVALMTKHPELCDKLLRRFERPACPYKSRALILDLLAGVGTPKAQDAMRLALSAGELQSSASERALLMQRFSFVAAPTRTTTQFVADQAAQSTGPLHSASLYALGSVVGHLARSGDDAEAREHNSLLRTKLGQTEDVSERRDLLVALGNTGLPENYELLRSFAFDADPSMRSQVATSLRKDYAPEGRATLISLSGDQAPEVARTAVQTLATQLLDAQGIGQVAQAIINGVTSPEVDMSLANLLAPHLQECDRCQVALQSILSRAGDRLALAARVRQLQQIQL